MTRHAIPRREALRHLGLLTGGALSASTVAGILAGCRADVGGHAFRALDRRQHALTDTLVDLILPETDTPGARAAGVPAFIDTLLADWMDDGERGRFLAGLADVDARADAAHGRRFVDLEPDQQVALLTALDAEAYPESPPAESPPTPAQDATAAAAGNALQGTDAMQDAAEATVGTPDTTAAEAPAEEPPPPFFNTLKELTLAGYYTSEIGATQELHWIAAPGRFDADVPLADVGRTWA